MSEIERTGCQCACVCPFLADLPPLFGGVRALVAWRCPECKEAHAQKRGACAGEPKIKLHFLSASLRRTDHMSIPKETQIGESTLVPSPRPEDDRNFSFQHPDHRGEFMECDACRAKPGWPALCHGCLHNREVIGNLKRKEQ